ncbi:hypothetical protein M5M_14315 [Simiduia agarivorans SA1 = DSM 21679]|uniref:Uncharacterized protein n=2 Tax=Simiduia TaxID=447467 RepID=K4KLF8_SIMAS|nr:hypothetical protein M5M_14315 [Simiduia agarivorans SA1 = DSM 21679]
MKAISLAALLTLFALPTLAQDQTEYQAKLEALQATIQKLQNELNDAKSQRDSLDVELKRNESEISKLMQDIERINKQLAAEKKS